MEKKKKKKLLSAKTPQRIFQSSAFEDAYFGFITKTSKLLKVGKAIQRRC